MSREENVLDLKIVIINELIQRYNLVGGTLSNLLTKYSILEYIDICYESFCSAE